MRSILSMIVQLYINEKNNMKEHISSPHIGSFHIGTFHFVISRKTYGRYVKKKPPNEFWALPR